MMIAWLVVNAFLNTNKFSEINEWLVQAARKKDINLKIKTNAELLITLGESNRVNHKITNIDEPAFILFWDKDIRLAKILEQMGYKVYNSSSAIEICDDKSLTHIVLDKAGIPMARTILSPMTFQNIGYTNYDFLHSVADTLGFPIIIKECFGSFGQQVYLANSRAELFEKVKAIGTKPMLFQEYIKTSFGRDIRINVVGNKVITSMYRYSDNGDFRANISSGGKMKPYEPTIEEEKLAILCCKVIGLDFAGVDILFGPNEKPLVCEVNSNAHFKSIYECTKVDVADAILEDILYKLIKNS